MTDADRAHIRLILRHEYKLVTDSLGKRLTGIYSEHAAHGRLQSGLTVRRAIAAMKELAVQALADLKPKILEVSAEAEGFEELSITMTDILDNFRDHLPKVTQMASGRLPNDPTQSVRDAADELFDDVLAEVEQKLEIVGFEFKKLEGVAITAPKTSSTIKKGGRPPLEFCDEMWAAIATDLYLGILIPKTQADVQRAMTDWIEYRGYSAADATIKARARKLWDRIDEAA